MKHLKLFEEFDDLIDDIDLVFSNTHKSLFDIISKKVAYKLGYKMPKFLGNGTFGVYYKLDDTKGLKITYDKNEAIFADKIIDRDCEFIAKCYDIYEVDIKDSPFSKKIYAIVTELLDPLFDKEVDVYDEFIYDIVYNEHKLDYSLDEFKEIFSEYTDIKFLYNYYELYKSLVGIVKETESIFGTINLDIDNASNLGKWSRGFKLIDYGHTTKKVELNLHIIKINKIL